MRPILTLAAAAVAFPALAGPADALIARVCGIETLPQARAACIGALADGRLLALEMRLANATVGVQGARGPALRGFERNLAVLQKSWAADLKAACRQKDAVARETCRLERVLVRETQVETVLETAFAPLGGVPGQGGARIGDSLSVEIPVEIPGFGGSQVTVPVQIPPN